VADNQTEEKSLPASQKKLRDSRRKGKVSSSRDLVSGVSLLAMLIYLLMVWPTIRDHVMELIELVSRLHGQPFDTAWRQAVAVAVEVMWLTMLPIVVVLVLVIIVTGMVATMGPVFSFESIKPNFDNINPASGLKRIFSMRNVVEFAKGAFKVALLATVLFFVLRTWLQTMFYAPGCGEACIVPLLLAAAKPILAVAAIAFILIGILDISIQRWLFLRDMRMTKTEQKRERKDIEGDPMILSARKRERMRQSRAPRLGLSAASVIVTGGDYLVGIKYHKKDMPVPMIVLKSEGANIEDIRQAADEKSIPISINPALAADLVSQHRPGDYVNQRHFTAVARLLIENRLV
jgi:type III secretion protein U